MGSRFQPFKILFSGMGVIILVILAYLFFHWIGAHVSWDIGPISDQDFKRWVLFFLLLIAVKSNDCNCKCGKR